MNRARLIAIIDDDEAQRRGTGSLLRASGYAVRLYESAEDFCGSAQGADIACIISDVNMKGMSGIDLYALLRTRGRATPFIFVTGFSAELMLPLLAHDVYVLQKPFRAELLLRCVESALAGHPGPAAEPPVGQVEH